MGPMMTGTNYSNIRECMSKQVHYNQPEVETVSLNNFRFLFLVCVLLLIASFIVLYGEPLHKMIKRTKPIGMKLRRKRVVSNN